MPPVTCTRRLEWDAMHRVPRHESKCAAFHGHRYAAEITCQAPTLDDRGRVVDFGVVKERVGGWIDAHWDHTAILMRTDNDPACAALIASNAAHGRPVYLLDAPPTAEVIVAELARVAHELLADTGVTVVAVRLWETPNGSAEWRRGLDG
jgi:6-pyruvoyltetrahydropterin/6-carboxytetrahydropterin synthase